LFLKGSSVEPVVPGGLIAASGVALDGSVNTDQILAVLPVAAPSVLVALYQKLTVIVEPGTTLNF
jgi:hypothetical protein